MTSPELLFGLEAARYIAMIDELNIANWGTRYKFEAEEDFKLLVRGNLSRAMQTYWSEIIARAHLTAVTSILRSQHWIKAVIASAEIKNLLSFSASLRGLIESAADASTALGKIPRTLARDHADIARALSGDLGSETFVASEMENKLIHFSHARHLTKAERADVPASHNAMKVREYIDVLEKGNIPKIIECYRELCDLTHPGASSVSMWLQPLSTLEMELRAGQDESEIAQFLVEYQKSLVDVISFAFNPAIVTLRVLNYFALSNFHTPTIHKWDLSGVPLWQKCEAEFRQ